MRSALIQKRSVFVPRQSRLQDRILYTLAFIGFLALSGMTLIVYEALQVPETNLEAGIPFPKLASPNDKIEAIPNVTAATVANPPTKGGEPAYAYFYSTQPNEAEQSKVGKLRARPKPVKRTNNSSKPKKSS